MKKNNSITQAKNSFLIFIPVYNEASSITEILDKVRKSTPSSEILVIDDGSTDETPVLLKNEDNIHFIQHSQNEGYGKTLIDGFTFAINRKFDYVITLDSDEQHQPEEINKFTKAVENENWDIVSGSRYLQKNKNQLNEAPEDRKKINHRITKYINHLTSYNLTDSFCGFKLYKVNSLKKLNLTEYGYGMPLELWIQAWKLKFKIKEVPVDLIYLDKDANQTSSYRKVFKRYKYYLEIIEKEINDYEDISISSASR